MRLLERLPRETNKDYALRTIKDNIIHLDLPPGALVSANELASELGISRTPVREALLELERMKIVDITPQKKSMIALIDYELIREARFMRSVLECAVVEQVCEMATDEDITALEENIELQKYYLEKSGFTHLLELDDSFHKKLFDITLNDQIYTMVNSISIHFDRVRSMSLASVKDLKIVQDHEAIVKAVRENRPKEASRLMQVHLDRYKVDAEEIRRKYPQYFTAG